MEDKVGEWDLLGLSKEMDQIMPRKQKPKQAGADNIYWSSRTVGHMLAGQQVWLVWPLINVRRYQDIRSSTH